MGCDEADIVDLGPSALHMSGGQNRPAEEVSECWYPN